MLKNIVIRGAREGRTAKRLIAALLTLAVATGCDSRRVPTSQGSTMKTQVVVQWHGKEPDGLPSDQIFDVQNTLDALGDRFGFDSDGNDIGGGTVNFFLYADDSHVDAVVQEVVKLEHNGALPHGMRIGVAVYKDAARKNWTFRAVYPKDLQTFDLT